MGCLKLNTDDNRYKGNIIEMRPFDELYNKGSKKIVDWVRKRGRSSKFTIFSSFDKAAKENSRVTTSQAEASSPVANKSEAENTTGAVSQNLYEQQTGLDTDGKGLDAEIMMVIREAVRQTVSAQQVNVDGEETKGGKNKKGILAAVGAVVIFVLGGTFNGFFGKIGENVADNLGKFLELPDTVGSLEDRIESLEDRFDRYEEIVEEDHEALLIMGVVGNVETSSIINGISINYSMENNEFVLESPTWGPDDDLGTDQNGVTYQAKDLYDTYFVTIYEHEGDSVYFQGRFNQYNHWNGQCIINIYSNNKLQTIFEAIYNDGNIYRYKRVSSENNTWIITDRKNEGEYNSGETWIYNKTEECEKTFSDEDFNGTESYIADVDYFKDWISENIISYYNGNTSNGYYNDITGDAYLIKYFQPGDIKGYEGADVIRTFYQGEFENGQYDDEGYDAWYITRYPDTEYMYYQGGFADGEVKHNDENKEVSRTNLTYADILEILEEKGFSEYANCFITEYEYIQ